MLKRTPSLTEQVKNHIKQRIFDNEFADGKIPPELQLAQELNVSRNTVRDALSRLEIEGIIFRRQGAGTFVNQVNRLAKTRLEEVIPFDQLIAEHGYTPTVQLVAFKEHQTNRELAELFGLAPNKPLLEVHKLFLADDQPVVFNCTWLPMALIERAYTPDDFKAPLYQFLPEVCQQTLSYFLTEIVPLIAPSWLAMRLGLPSSDPTALMSFEEVGYNAENDPILKSVTYFRDDLLRLRLIRRLSGS